MGCVLHPMLLHTAAVVLDQIVNWFHSAFLWLRGIDCTSSHVLLLRLLLQFGFEACHNYKVLIVFLVVLAVVLLVLPAGAL